MALSKGQLFNPTQYSDLINGVVGHSSLARLSAQNPIPFNGTSEFIFNLDSEVDVVAENGAKSHGGGSVEAVRVVPIKIEYGMRVSDEFLYASEEEKINLSRAFVEGFAKKMAKGFDTMALHGLNPRTGEESEVIGTNHFDAKVEQTVTLTEGQEEEALTSAIMTVYGADKDVTGIALSKVEYGKMATAKDANGAKVFPEFTLSGADANYSGIKVDANNTVSPAVAYVGDFANRFKWGVAKEIPMQVIEYGDPDNSGKDLAGHNQVYLRAEAYIGWGILDAKAFAKVEKAEESGA